MVMEKSEARRLRAAGLIHAPPESLGLVRRGCGRGFIYVDATGRRVRDAATLRRIRSLAIPPAYSEVRIAERPDQHLQALGRDEAGRLQYLYHPAWEAVREARKEDRLAALCAVLPALRRRLARTLRREGLDRERVLAAAVTLIDRTHIRVGCSDYVHSGRSRGAATLLKRHVQCDDDGHIRLAFHGKRRKPVECAIYAPALARVLRELQELPGRRLFQYRDANGGRYQISAADINGYLQEVTGTDVTAKDFRTLAATAAAGKQLCATPPAARPRERQRQVADAMRDVGALLGNTPAVARRSYVHRRVIEAFDKNRLAGLWEKLDRRNELSREEALIAALFPAGEQPGDG